jgi:hypothetical protein
LGNAFCGDPADGTKQFAYERRPLTNDLSKIARYLSCQRKERIGIFPEFLCNAMNCFLSWRRLLPALYLAQVGRFDAYAACQLAHGESGILGGSAHSALTQELSKWTFSNHV